MKLVRTILIAIFVFALFGCENRGHFADSTSPPIEIQKSKYVGTWSSGPYMVVFNSDGTGIISCLEDAHKVTWRENGDHINITERVDGRESIMKGKLNDSGSITIETNNNIMVLARNS